MNGPRIVSLMPAATEWLTLLHATDLLVGGTARCRRISGLHALPVVLTGPASRALSMTPSEPLERSARDHVDAEAMQDLAPDLVIANAWDERWDDDTEGRLLSWSGGEAEIWWWDARTMRDVLELALLTGRRIRRFERAMQVMGDRERELRIWRDRIGLHRRAPDQALIRTAVVSSLEQPVLAGGWTAELVDRAALLQVGPASGRPSERVTWEAVLEKDPQLVILAIRPDEWDHAGRIVAGAGISQAARVVCYDPEGRLDSAGPGLHDAILDLAAIAHELDGRDLARRARRL